MVACPRCGEMNDLAAPECAACGSAMLGAMRQASADASGLRRTDSYARWAIAPPGDAAVDADRNESERPGKTTEDRNQLQRRALIDRLLAPADAAGFRAPQPGGPSRSELRTGQVATQPDALAVPERPRPEADRMPRLTDVVTPAARRSPWLIYGLPAAVLTVALVWMFRSFAPGPAGAPAISAAPASSAAAESSARSAADARTAVARAAEQMASAPPAAGVALQDARPDAASASASVSASEFASASASASAPVTGPEAMPAGAGAAMAEISPGEPVAAVPRAAPPVVTPGVPDADRAVVAKAEPAPRASRAGTGRARVSPAPPPVAMARTVVPPARSAAQPARAAQAVNAPCTRAIAALGLCTLEAP